MSPTTRASTTRRARSLRLVAAIACSLYALDADAQCGAARSTCSSCHDGVQAAYDEAAPWHHDHCFADLCVSCHGGRGDQATAAAAHVGVVATQTAESCASCHGERTSQLLYAPKASAPPAPSAKAHPHGSRGPNLALGGVAVLLAAAFVVVVHRERGR